MSYRVLCFDGITVFFSWLTFFPIISPQSQLLSFPPLRFVLYSFPALTLTLCTFSLVHCLFLLVSFLLVGWLFFLFLCGSFWVFQWCWSSSYSSMEKCSAINTRDFASARTTHWARLPRSWYLTSWRKQQGDSFVKISLARVQMKEHFVGQFLRIASPPLATRWPLATARKQGIVLLCNTITGSYRA